jgi:GNAT superfamily N-acetyltransferase
MIGIKNQPQPRDMKINDLDDVAEVHKKCFSASISIFSALSSDILKLYYRMFIDEPESYAVVLENQVSGRVVGVVIGTGNPGIQGRFLKRYRTKFFWDILKGLFSRKAVWEALFARFGKKNSLQLGKYEPALADIGIPAPKGPENINMAIALHPDFRGKGNSARLLEFYNKRVFEDGAVRIRGAVLASNIASVTFFERQGWTFLKISDTQFSIWLDRLN